MEMKRIETFYESTLLDLQRSVNTWIEKNRNGIEIKDIQYQALYNSAEDNEYYTAFIIGV